MRKSYLVHKAFRKFLTASILSSAASQLALTTDAVIVGQLIGGDGLSAINLIIPLIAVLGAIGVLFASGTEIVIAKSFGVHDETMTANIFSTSILLSVGVGFFFSVILFAGGGWFLSLLYPAVEQLSMAQEYLQIYALGIVFLFVGLTIQFLMDADGNPATATKLVVLSGVVNIVLDIVLIKYLRMGIRVSALATGISSSVLVIGSLPYFLKKTASFHWRVPGFDLFRSIAGGILKNGMLLLTTNLVIALFVFLINAIVIHASNQHSLFTWSVCVQIMLLTSIAINGGIMVMFGLGGNLFGEHDLLGLTFLYRRIILFLTVFFILFIIAVLLWPDWLIILFQNGETAVPSNSGHRIAIFCLMFLPFSIVMVTSALYQVLEYMGLGIALTVGLFICMILSVWGLSFISADTMWWSFLAGSGAVFFSQILYSLKIRIHDPNRCFFTLIPQKIEGKILDLSIEYTMYVSFLRREFLRSGE